MSESVAWRTLALGDVTSEVTERFASSEKDVPVYGVDRNTGLTDEPKYSSDDLSRYKRLQPGMFAYNPMRLNIGSIGYCSRKHGPGLVSPDYVAFRCVEDRLDPDFLSYYVRSPVWRAWTRASGVGSVRVRIYYRELARMQITLPPLAEQRAIAHILGTLEDKVEVNRRMGGTLEAMARALFKSWFVHFDPVRAKADGRDSGLRKPLADLFPPRFVDSALGEIPAGFEVGTLGDLAALNPEARSKDTRPDVIRYVDLSNTKWGRIEAVTTYPPQDAPSRAQRVLRPGDTIVGTVRPGNGSYSFISEDGLTGSTGFSVLRPRRPDCAEFVYLAATSAENIRALAHMADGAAYPAVHPEDVIATPVVQPDHRALAGFSRVARPLLAKTAQNERESRMLAALRDRLLPKLVSGDLRVRDAGWRLAQTGTPA